MKKIVLTPIIICLILLIPADIYASAKDRDAIILKRLVEMINETRSKGRACRNRIYRPSVPLKWDERLARAARIHASDMAERNMLSHKGGDRSDPGERIRASGYRWRAYGENIGEGYLKPEEILSAWLRSEGHCENIMNPLFRDVGAALAKKSGKTYWVLVLGTPSD